MVVNADAAVHYESFENLELYDASVAFAKKHGFLLWSSDQLHAFTATQSGGDLLRMSTASATSSVAPVCMTTNTRACTILTGTRKWKCGSALDMLIRNIACALPFVLWSLL